MANPPATPVTAPVLDAPSALEAARLARYVVRTHRGLEQALIRAEGARRRQAGAAQTTLSLDASADRWVILSDQHRGGRNRADDFRRAERAYNAALAYYYEQGYTLVLLGDVEELWQERPRTVIRSYPRSYELEGDFHRAGRLHRIWGNHDDLWESPDAVRSYLEPVYGPPAPTVHESLLITVLDGGARLGDLFLVHGHQGTSNNDRFGGLARLPVRYLWRPIQRLTGISLNTPAESLWIRRGHNWALYQWAASHERLVLIAGHTHQPIFEPHLHLAKLRRRLARRRVALAGRLDDADARQGLAESAADLDWAAAAQELEPALEAAPGALAKPCYFNTGCCCFRDGDVTGLEIAGGEIRLVRWPDRAGRPRPLELASASLAEVFQRLGGEATSADATWPEASTPSSS